MRRRFVDAALALVVAVSIVKLFPQCKNLIANSFQENVKINEVHAPVRIDLVDPVNISERLAGTLRFRTVSSVSFDNHAVEPEEFKALHKFLRQNFPVVFEKLEVRKVNELSLLFKWKGSEASLKPVLCVSHMDVVAVGSEDRWTHPAFSGTITDGHIWGRGALDLKFSVAALLEAVSHLLAQGVQPTRTVYLAFGHDEEVGGGLGAAAMASLLESEGMEFDHILDEGGSVLVDGMRGLLKTPVAVVGTAEKAVQNMEIEVHGKGGHSMAPRHDGSSVASRLARIVQKIEASFPTPIILPPTSQLLKTLAGATENWATRLLLPICDQWPVSILLAKILARQDPELGSTLRTTAAVTDIQLFPPGRNVVPSLGKAFISYRLSPYDSPERIRKQLQTFAAQESRTGEVKVSGVEHVRLSPVSSTDSLGYKLVKQAAEETLTGPEGLVVAPYLMLGRTDSTNYIHLSGGNIYRFASFTVNRTAGDLQRIHGIDERIGIDTYLDGVRFYVRYLQLVTA